ncbi:MAG: orotidine-5'-phosphate decarboxylase, partial [Deltaproteobacteria bacterium]
PELPPGFLKDMEIGQTKILAVTLLTSIDNGMLKDMGYATSNPRELVISRATWAMKIGCHGVVCSGQEVGRVKEVLGSSLVTVVPGIRPRWSVSKDDQRRIVTPSEAVLSGADYIVVGRPIRDAKDPKDAASRIVDEIEAAVNS